MVGMGWDGMGCDQRGLVNILVTHCNCCCTSFLTFLLGLVEIAENNKNLLAK